MNFDAVTIAAVRDEIEKNLLGGRVERVVLPGDLALGLECYAKGKKQWLLATAHPQHARVHLTRERLRRVSEDVSPLLLLARKYIRDGRLVGVAQLPWERVLTLEFEKRDDDGTLLKSSLIIEVMGRHSNIVLVDAEGRVLDSAKRVSQEMSRFRVILPRAEYQPPPPQQKRRPDSLLPGELATLCLASGADALLYQALVNALQGFSPLVAREVAFRATGSPLTPLGEVHWPAAEAAVNEFVADVTERRWRPCLGLVDGEVVAFAAYELRHVQERREVETVSEALDEFFAGARPSPQQSDLKRAELAEVIASLEERNRRKLRSLRGSMPGEEDLERPRLWGELLLAYASQIPAGSEHYEVDGQRIELDPTLSPVENAQRYFREYQKAKSAVSEVGRLLEEAEAEAAFLAQARTDLELASTPAEVAEVRQELIAAGLLKEEVTSKRKQQPKRALPAAGLVRSRDGFEIFIGRSARLNEYVTFELGAGNDIWLHARGVPGAHVIVKARGREVPETTIAEAAAYAAYMSQGREATKVDVDYTLQRNVRRRKGGPPGLVTYTGEKTIQVRPAQPPAAK